MFASTRSRYGYRRELSDPARMEAAVRELVDDLCEEQFARPDYEHQRISVSHPNGWYVETSMEGVTVLGHHDRPSEPERYQYGLLHDELERVFLLVARGRIDEVLAMGWFTEPAAMRGRGDFYLFRNRPDMTDLHRAAAKGDADWLRSELAAGASVEARDKSGATPLHWAALAGQIEACRILLVAGASADATDRDGETVRDYAEGADEYIGPAGLAELRRVLR